METITLQQAFWWECPACGAGNFAKAVVAELTDDEKGNRPMARETRTVWLIMVLHSAGNWVRTGNVYRTREVAQSWLPFVSAAKRRKAKVLKVDVELIDGVPTAEAIERFDREFNIDLGPRPPAEVISHEMTG